MGDGMCPDCNRSCFPLMSCNCCPWCCTKCSSSGGCSICAPQYQNRLESKECHPSGCSSRIIKCDDINKCGCNCCVKQRRTKPVASSDSHSSTSGRLSNTHSGVTAARSGDPGPDSDNLSTTSPPFRPDPQAIAAVIVAVIVAVIFAIILLDLCIFRFPVGRNIRDFLIRKIPFCIAFYS